jgi:hypothetical protein
MMYKVLIPTIAALVGSGSLGLAAEVPSSEATTILEVGQNSPEVSSLAQQAALSTLLSVDLPQVAPVLAQAAGSDQFGGSFTPSEDLKQLLNDLTPLVDTRKPWPTPGTTFGTPTAYGANWRQAFVGSSGIVDFGGAGRTDGSFSVGAGFGDSVNSLGAEVSISVTSVSAGDFGDSGSFGLKLHKIIPNTGGLGLALGWSNALDWGDTTNAPESIYGVASKTFALRPNNSTNRMPLSVSLGMGTGGFRSTGAIAAGNNDPNLFGSLGVVLIPQISLASSWTGSQWNLGMGVSPFRIPLTFSLGFTDVTNNTVNGTGFNINAGYALRF